MKKTDGIISTWFIPLLLVLMFQPLRAAATESLRGDVNGDGEVSIADVSALIDCLLGNDTVFSEANADVDRDGEIGISDVAMLIDYLLSGDPFPPEEVEIEEITVNGVTFTMVTVEGGTFTMGATAEQGTDPIDRERPAHQVMLSSFHIGQTEVTQALWQAVMGENPSSFKGAQLPVEQVSWDECQAFIMALNVLADKNFRLPTEAEWEFAARGGNMSLGYKYAGSNEPISVAWYSYNDSWEPRGTGYRGPHPVATRNPNELGLYDMSGNVHEWCHDWFANYGTEPQIDPLGPQSGSARVYRGGNWYFDEWFCRVSFRNSVSPNYHSYGIGLRLAY